MNEKRGSYYRKQCIKWNIGCVTPLMSTSSHCIIHDKPSPHSSHYYVIWYYKCIVDAR